MNRRSSLLLVLLAVIAGGIVLYLALLDTAARPPVTGVDSRSSSVAESEPSDRDRSTIPVAAGTLAYDEIVSDAPNQLENARTHLALEVVLRTGSVGGRVFDERGEPVKEFTIMAVRVDGGAAASNANKVVHARFEDELGAFEIEGLADGQWFLAASQGSSGGAHVRVTMPHEGAPLELVLLRPVTVRGVVRDVDGRPAAGAYLTVSWAEGSHGWGTEIDHAGKPTREDGRFEIRGLRSGMVKLLATHEDAADSETQTVGLMPGQEIDDIVLDLRRGGRLVGQVLDATGKPEVGCKVHVSRGSAPGGRGRDATTGSSGEFALDHLNPGSAYVETRPGTTEDALVRDANHETPPNRPEATQHRAVIEIVDGATATVVLGGVRADAVRVFGVVRGSAPVEGAKIWVRSTRDGIHEHCRAVTDANGRYELSLRTPGHCEQSIQLPSGSSVMRSAEVPAATAFEWNVQLGAGVISGRVIDADRAPVARIHLMLQHESDPESSMSSSILGHVSTDETGAFAFRDLEAGTYSVHALPDSRYGSSTVHPELANAVKHGLVVNDDTKSENVELRVTSAGALTVLVLWPTGVPAAGAWVSVRHLTAENATTWTNSSVTDNAGRFWVDGLNPGTYSVSANTATSVARASAGIVVQAKQTSDVTLRLEPGTFLRVVAEDQVGHVTKAHIRLEDDRGESVQLGAQPHAESALGMRFGPLVPGTYRVYVRGGNGSTGTDTLQVSGSEQQARVRLIPQKGE